jgi:hypothetical protein
LPPELEKGVFQAQGGVPGWSVEEKLEGSLIKLKLLAEEKMEPSLVKLELLLEKRMVEFLVRLELLLEERMVRSLVKLDLKHVEEENSLQIGSPMFPLQKINRG